MNKHRKSLCLTTIGLGSMFAQLYNQNNNPFYTGILPQFAEGFGQMTDTYLDATNTFGKVATGFSPQGRWNATKLGMDNGLKSIGLSGLSGNKPTTPSGWTNAGWTNSAGKLSGKGIAGIATQGAGIVSNMLAGQNSTAAGNVMNTLGDVASMIPGPYGAIIGGGLKVVGGLTNAMFGSHLNQEFINSKTKEMNSVASASSDAQNTTDFANDFSSRQGVAGFSKKDVGSDGWFSHKARNKYRSMLAASNAANAQSIANLNSVGRQINQNNTMLQLGNLTAFGGPLEYGLALDYINNGMISAQAKNRMYAQPNLGVQAGLFAFGGDVQGDGGDYPTGLTHIDAGDTHEGNPYEGVPLGVDAEGVPNLVEENEVVYDDYVFSARLKVPRQKVKKGERPTREQRLLNRYKGLTYADAAKKIEHNTGVDERPNDPIAKRGFEADLQILAMSLEKERAALQLKDQKKQIDNMSAEEFAQQQAQALAYEQQAMAEQAALQQAVQQLNQAQPDVNAQLPLEQVPVEQVPTEGQLLFAEGGQMPLQGDDTDTNPLNTLDNPEGQQDANATLQLAVLQDNTLQETEQLQQETSSPTNENNQEDSQQSAEDMSTSQLNQTIDQILLWARQNNDRELAKQARKARRASREDKEDFVDDALDEIREREQQAQQAQALAQAQLAAQVLQQDNNVQLVETQPLELQLEQNPTELLLQDQGQQFAEGGNLAIDLPSEQQTLNSEAYIQRLLSFMEAIGSLDDQNAKNIYNQYTDFILNNDLDSALLLADLTYKQYIQAQQAQQAQLQQNTYAEGGHLKNSADGKINTYEDFLKFVQDNNLDIRKVLGAIRNTDKRFGAKHYNSSSVLAYLDLLDNSYRQGRFNTLIDNSNRALLEGLAKSLGINYSGSEYSNAGTGDQNLRKLIKSSYNNDLYTKAINYATPSSLNYIADPQYSYSANDISNFIANTVTPYQESKAHDRTGKDNGYYAIAANLPKGYSSVLEYERSEPYQAFDSWLKTEFSKDNPSQAAIDWAKAMDAGVASGVEHLLDSEGKPKDNILDLLFGADGKTGRRNDGKMGIYHWNPTMSRTMYQLNGRTVDYDPSNPNPYITVSDKPVTTRDDNGYITNTYNLTYSNIPDSDSNSNDGDGIKSKRVPYKLPSTWPMYLGLGLSAANLGYNILNPADHSNGDAIIAAANEVANPMMVGARYAGQEYAYNPVSNTYLAEPILNLGRSTARDLFNASNGNTGALMSGLLLNNHNIGLLLADANIKGIQYNNGERYKHVNLGLTRDLKNYDRQLQADIANQEALLKARQSRLEGQYKGYAMNEAADLAKAQAIGAGITDLAGMVDNIWKQNQYNNMVKYGLDTSTFGSATYKEANGGKLRTVRVRRPRGLMF